MRGREVQQKHRRIRDATIFPVAPGVHFTRLGVAEVMDRVQFGELYSGKDRWTRPRAYRLATAEVPWECIRMPYTPIQPPTPRVQRTLDAVDKTGTEIGLSNALGPFRASIPGQPYFTNGGCGVYVTTDGFACVVIGILDCALWLCIWTFKYTGIPKHVASIIIKPTRAAAPFEYRH
jgi:hypothetical protein